MLLPAWWHLRSRILGVSMKHDEKILQVSNLKVTLQVQALLTNISFGVRRGKVVAILGSNGAGKTMLLRALLCMLPYQGSILYEKELRRGYLPQQLLFNRNIPFCLMVKFRLAQHDNSNLAKRRCSDTWLRFAKASCHHLSDTDWRMRQ